MVCGVYKIENIVSGKTYYGQSVCIKERWKAHLSQLRSNCHHNTHLQNSWNKHGEENFEFSIVEVCEPENRRTLEKKYIRELSETKYNFNDDIYNIVGLKSYVSSEEILHTMSLEENKYKSLTILAEELNVSKDYFRDTVRELIGEEEYRLRKSRVVSFAHKKTADKKFAEKRERYLKILQYGEENCLSSNQLAKHFKISRNTLTRICKSLHGSNKLPYKVIPTKTETPEQRKERQLNLGHNKFLERLWVYKLALEYKERFNLSLNQTSKDSGISRETLRKAKDYLDKLVS